MKSTGKERIADKKTRKKNNTHTHVKMGLINNALENPKWNSFNNPRLTRCLFYKSIIRVCQKVYLIQSK